MNSFSKPAWLRKKIVFSVNREMKHLLREYNLHTVCESASCPNISECFKSKTATFIIMGNICTRRCKFCGVRKGKPSSLDPTEQKKIAAVVKKLKLAYVVITCVTRDDISDGGAAHFADVIREIRSICDYPVKLEVLTSDFYGGEQKNLIHSKLVQVLDADVDVFGHNIETVKRLYSETRYISDYSRSLDVLRCIKKIKPSQITKTALMVGLGESRNEIRETMQDIRQTGCDIFVIGQYLAPSNKHIPVLRYYTPEEFEELKQEAMDIGFKAVEAKPFIRSSYRAKELYKKCVSV